MDTCQCGLFDYNVNPVPSIWNSEPLERRNCKFPPLKSLMVVFGWCWPVHTGPLLWNSSCERGEEFQDATFEKFRGGVGWTVWLQCQSRSIPLRISVWILNVDIVLGTGLELYNHVSGNVHCRGLLWICFLFIWYFDSNPSP